MNKQDEPRAIVLTGVAGAGKTTVGRLLSHKLQWPFFDADEFHPPRNIRKMADGIPLEDEDRWPWLENLRQKIQEELAAGRSAVFACSALKKTYRTFLRAAGPRVQLVFLRGDAPMIEKRIAARQNHFMKEGMLSSQLADLEEPETSLTVDVSASPEAIATQILQKLAAKSND